MDDTARICGGKSTGGGGISENSVTTKDVVVTANQAQEEAKYESQQTTIITAEDIAKKQAKSVEDIIFQETGMSRNVDAMGRVTVSIRGAEPRHTLILVDGQPVMGDFAKYSGQGDELQRLGTENVERIEIIQGAASAKYGSDAIGGVINVVTKRPAKEAGLQVNAEGRRVKGDSDIFPYQNFFLRADSGEIGKFRAAIYGGKRDIMPVYGTNEYETANTKIRESLRYFGEIKNIGMSAVYDINDRNQLEFNMDKTQEDMKRNQYYVMDTQFKRQLDRNTYRMAYTGNNGGNTDWKITYDYSKMRENDVTVSSMWAASPYNGSNTLNYVDDIMHKQYDIKAAANTQINDKHLLSYGFGYTKETGEGSRLKNAPNTTTKYIDPWAYDKNLKEVYTNTSGKPTALGPSSEIHDYAMSFHENGVPYYDQDYEYYGATNANEVPAYTYEDYYKYGPQAIGAPDDVIARRDAFAEQLKAQNPNVADFSYASTIVQTYFNYDSWNAYGLGSKFNGKVFKEEYNARQNRQTIGSATIKKENFYIGDTWQVNDNTILSPIMRLDHSDLFGSEVTFNLGLTHNLGGHANRRFKANIGTGYTEPGMGELYYSWEMYAGHPASVPDLGSEIGRLGYYWVGNPYLKPEKSVNIDMGFEAENKNTSTRINVFHNKIDDYMTTYFTGEIMDFHPGASTAKFISPPDMIYSFKNIGKAEITGVEAEINQKFGKHWSGKLGYTYLHAINKSDPDMPRQLLNKPQHKVDIGVSYENAGWRASLWGDYYIHMLDSNSIAGNGNYMESDDNTTHYFFTDSDKITYQKKTFGLWNILVQKEIDKDSTVYFGIDNIFNHRDDDQAFMERVYKFGVNLKFGSDGSVKADAPTVEKAVETAREKIRGEETTDWFIKAPFDTTKKEGIEVIGDYRARWNSFTGKSKPAEARVTTTSSVGSAYKNYLEKADHGFEQRLRLGVDARIGENTNVTVLGSASGMSGVDTMYDKSDSKGLNHQRVENIDVTQHANKWDFSVGRLTEPMGVTGYWFGKEYDGGRAVWTSGKNQVRIGYGDFSHSTGIMDSAYTHATKELFLRPPTKSEWMGYNLDSTLWPQNGNFTDCVLQMDGYDGLYQKLAKASSLAEQQQIVNEYLDTVKQIDSSEYDNIMSKRVAVSLNLFAWQKYSVYDRSGNHIQDYLVMVYPTGDNPEASTSALNFTYISIDDAFDKDTLEAVGEKVWQRVEDQLEPETVTESMRVYSNEGIYLSTGKYTVEKSFYGYGQYTGDAIAKELKKNICAIPMEEINDQTFTFFEKDEAKEKAIASLWDSAYSLKKYYSYKTTSSGTANGVNGYGQGEMGNAVYEAMKKLHLWEAEDDYMPLHSLEALGIVMPQYGTVLVQDQIPSIDRAAFVQAKHQMGDHFGVQAWYLRSVNDDTHSLAYAHGDSNDVYSYDRLANIIGLGAAWRVSDNLRFSFDWGQNRTDFGRMMNGNTIYTHESGTSDFDIEGRSKGGTPRFWVARIDVGHADMDKPGSWNAFADYKYFQHGSFFGGNGTEALPDRYLDGIKSFTIGGGYVPAKDFLIEAFYTFDAKGIGKRDTLYGSENFTLGDYTRIQATFRF